MTFSRSRPLQIAIIGDIHDQWQEADNEALIHLGVDLVLFVGDFGNESVDVVQIVADLPLPKAAIFGNHDAWYTASPWGRKQCPYDRRQEDRVQQQFDLLWDTEVGYGKKDFPKLNLSVVGSRPFSWGGEEWKNHDFLAERYGITNFKESAAKIIASARAITTDRLIFLGHNGPTGLGDRAEDICGRDWQPIGGDHGDPDLAEAIAKVRDWGKPIPLVTFGHMHYRLRHTQERLRTQCCRDDFGTLYLNAANVPRFQIFKGKNVRHFAIATLDGDCITDCQQVWVTAAGEVVERSGMDLALSSPQALIQ